MRYYEARQRVDSQWDWTVMHNKKITAAGPCLPTGEETMCQHKTREEAERHFYYDEIKKVRETVFDDSSLHKCEFPDCKEYTHKALTSHYLFSPAVLLCDTHRNINDLQKVRPFETGKQIWKS